MLNIKKKNLTQYINDSIKLSKSMHIYLDVLKIHSRIITYKMLGYVPDDKDNKYILNLAGLKAKYDPDVFLNLDGNKFLLTKENLNNNQYIREYLSRFDTVYDTVCKQYTSMNTYIKGTIANLDLEDVLNRKDGEILWYCKDYLDNDRNIIMGKVQEFIYNFLATYNVRDYVVDELYATGLVSNLYSLLPTVILVEKLNNVFTHKADDFHIYQYFKSNKALDEQIDVLDKSTLIWLYGNLDYIKKHIGSNDTLDLVLTKVMDNLGLGVGRMFVEKSLPKLTKNLNDPKQPLYYKDIKTRQYRDNNSFILNVGKVEPISNVVVREYNQNYIKDKDLINTEILDIESKFKYNKFTKELSKVLPIDDIILTNNDDINRFAYFVNTFIYKVEKEKTNEYMNFFNPYDGGIYNLNSKQILALFLYLVFKILKIDLNTKINYLVYANVLDIDSVSNFNIDNYKLDETGKKLASVIFSDVKDVPTDITTYESFLKYFNISYKILHKFWRYLSFINDNIYSNNMLMIINNIFTTGKATFLYNKTLKEFMIDVNLPIREIPDESTELVFVRLIETIINNNVYKIDYIKSILNKILDIGKKLTSYTVQFLYSNDLNYVITGHYQTLKPNLGKRGYITIEDAEFTYYDKVKKDLHNKFIPMLNFIDIDNVSNIFRLYKPYKLKITYLDKQHMLTKIDDISFIKNPYKFPAPYKPVFNNISKDVANTITETNQYTYNYVKSYTPQISTHKDYIDYYTYVNNSDINSIPKVFSPNILNVPGYLENTIYQQTQDTLTIKYPTKLKLTNLNNITGVNYSIFRNDTIPKNYSPNTYYQGDNVNDIKEDNVNIPKYKLTYNPQLINYNNIITTLSRIRGNKELNLLNPIILNYDYNKDKLTEMDYSRDTKNIPLGKPIMKNVPEIITNREDLINYKIKPFAPKGKGVDPYADIVEDSINYSDIIKTSNISITVSRGIFTNYTNLLNSDINFYNPDILNHKEDLNYKEQDNSINKTTFIKPTVKNVPEILTTREDINNPNEEISPYKPNGGGVDPYNDIIEDNKEDISYREIEPPSVKAIPSDDMEDIPVIKIKR